MSKLFNNPQICFFGIVSNEWNLIERLTKPYPNLPWNKESSWFEIFLKEFENNLHIKKKSKIESQFIYSFKNWTKIKMGPINLFRIGIEGSSLNLKTTQHW
jgi:hypothetical protein